MVGSFRAVGPWWPVTKRLQRTAWRILGGAWQPFWPSTKLSFSAGQRGREGLGPERWPDGSVPGILHLRLEQTPRVGTLRSDDVLDRHPGGRRGVRELLGAVVDDALDESAGEVVGAWGQLVDVALAAARGGDEDGGALEPRDVHRRIVRHPQRAALRAPHVVGVGATASERQRDVLRARGRGQETAVGPDGPVESRRLDGVVDGRATGAGQAGDRVAAAGLVLRVDQWGQLLRHVGLVLLAAVVDPVGVPTEGPTEGRHDVDVLVAEEALQVGESEPALAARREVSTRVEVVAAVDAGQQIERGRTRPGGLEDVVDDDLVHGRREHRDLVPAVGDVLDAGDACAPWRVGGCDRNREQG